MLMATSLPGGTQPLSSTVMSGHKTPSLCLTRHGRRAAERAPAGHDGDVASENCAKWLLSYLLAGEVMAPGREWVMARQESSPVLHLIQVLLPAQKAGVGDSIL